jgi:tetratricopeptide (TPR) repeat protein
VLAGSGVVRNGFINYDDNDYIAANPFVARGLTADGALWALTTTQSSNWHPLTWLSHMLDVQLFGMNPGAHHLVGLGLHAANAALLYLLLLRLTGARWRSALVAALFAVHPLHVESFAWASERKDVLSTALALGAMLAYERAARAGRVASARALPLLFLLALLAKPMPVTLPLLLLLLDWWPLGRWAPGGAWRLLPPARLWLEKAPLLALAAASATTTLLVQRRAGAMAYGADLTLLRRVANAALSLAAYLRRTIWPLDLAAFYPYPARDPSPWLWGGILGAAAAVTVLLVRGSRRRPAAAVGWFWCLGGLAPVIGLVQVGSQAMADRYTYLPLAGVFIAVAWGPGGGRPLRPARAGLAAVASCAALLACVALTRAQVARWRDSFSLHERSIAVTEGNWTAWNLLGNAYVERHDLEHAIAAYRTASRFAEAGALRTSTVDFNLAAALQAQGRTAEAAAVYRAVLARDPGDRDALNNLGNIRLDAGDPDEAVALFRRALAAAPGFSAARFNLARALAALGDDGGAVRELRGLLALEPRDEGARQLLEALARRPAPGADAGAARRAAAPPKTLE